VDEAQLEILPGYEQTLFRLDPGVVTLRFSDVKTEKWAISGGFAFIHTFGPVDVHATAAYKLDDLDSKEVKAQLESAREQLEGPKYPRAAIHAKINIAMLEPIIEAIEG